MENDFWFWIFKRCGSGKVRGKGIKGFRGSGVKGVRGYEGANVVCKLKLKFKSEEGRSGSDLNFKARWGQGVGVWVLKWEVRLNIEVRPTR